MLQENSQSIADVVTLSGPHHYNTVSWIWLASAVATAKQPDSLCEQNLVTTFQLSGLEFQLTKRRIYEGSSLAKI